MKEEVMWYKTAFVLIASLCFSGTTYAQGKSAKDLLGNVTVGPAPAANGQVNVPVILWGGEASTFLANGGTTTVPSSIYGQLGLKIKLTPGDDSIQQARDYISGKSPFYRGTFRMACLFAEQFNADPRTKPVMFMQHSYSLGDHMVAVESIKSLNDLAGKRICLQQGGPHLGLVEDSLKAAALTWSDVEIVWAEDLVGPKGPAEMMRQGKCDVACVITPDMIGLCSGLDEVGSGAEGTVQGSHVVNSTTTMSRSIADVYICRKDFFDANKEWVEKFVIGYLKATEEVVADRKKYDASQSVPKYTTMMNQLQKFFGEDALPTIEEDVHGLILDCSFARIPGNEVFFNDPKNLTGFNSKQTSGLDLAVTLGYAKQKLGFETAGWDYKAISQAAGVNYVKPVYTTGRVRAEVADFGMDLDSSTIFSFEINFQPEQTTFPIETYASDFKRFSEAQATFGNAAIIVEGHSDPTLVLQHFFWAAKSKGLLTGSKGQYMFNGKPLGLTETESVINAIQTTNLAGQQRQDSRTGRAVEIPDPKTTVAAALTLSQARATQVKKAIEDFAQKNGYQIDFSAVLPLGVGIASPVNPRPRNMAQAKENMRVVFRVVKVKAEALSEDDFNFDE